MSHETRLVLKLFGLLFVAIPGAMFLAMLGIEAVFGPPAHVVAAEKREAERVEALEILRRLDRLKPPPNGGEVE